MRQCMLVEHIMRRPCMHGLKSVISVTHKFRFLAISCMYTCTQALHTLAAKYFFSCICEVEMRQCMLVEHIMRRPCMHGLKSVIYVTHKFRFLAILCMYMHTSPAHAHCKFFFCIHTYIHTYFASFDPLIGMSNSLFLQWPTVAKKKISCQSRCWDRCTT